jgi:hypothetical protein
MVSLRDVPQNALESTKKEYKKEVALMGEVRRGGKGWEGEGRLEDTQSDNSPLHLSFAPRTQSKSSGQSHARPSSSS